LRAARTEAGIVESLSSTRKETTFDMHALVRLALGLAAAGFLAATFIVSLWLSKARGVTKPLGGSNGVVPLALLAATSVLLAVGPRLDSAPFVAAQAILLAASAAIFSLSWTMRKEQAAETAKLIDTATVDALTRIASHRVFQDRLSHECERAYRFGDTFMLAMLDLDNFHQVNNRYGHRVGDKILLDLARRMRTQLREIDLVARFAGDQFAMILPHTYEKGGVEVAERLRQHIAGWVFFDSEGQEIRITVSLGLCSYPSDGATATDLVDVALKALGFAKAMGGNQVQLYRDLPSKEAPSNVVSLPHSGRGAIVRSLAAAVDIRDGYTHEHSRLVSELSAAVAMRIGLDPTEVSRIKVGAMLHDVGKIGVPDAILAKGGGLSPEEWTSIQKHPLLGKQIMEQAPELTDVVPLVLHHQERWDGKGYPQRLHGDQIPLGARIIAAADAYHAIRSDRPYRSGRTHREATHELRRCAGGQFDPQVVEVLLQILETDEELRAMLPSDGDYASLGTPAAPRAVAAPTYLSAQLKRPKGC
jgi:diguanylate cyclase (GGDEF)-like protein